MATRALLRFVGTRADATPERAQVYRHADGDPANLVPTLARVEETLDATGTRRGAGYAAAQFVYLDKRRMGRWPAPLLGHAVVDSATPGPGDESYRYRIDVDGAWRVAVSERRGFDRETPFAATRWQFDGPLDEAADAFAGDRQ